MHVLHGEIRVSVIVEGMVRWARKGGQEYVEYIQVLLAEKEKLAGQSGKAR